MYKSKIAGMVAGGIMLAGTALGGGLDGLPKYTADDIKFVSMVSPRHVKLGYDTTGDNWEDVGIIRLYNSSNGQVGPITRIMWDKNGDHKFHVYDDEIFDIDSNGNAHRPEVPGDIDI